MNPARILLVDDDETLVSLLSEHLRMAGYQLETANGGEQALTLAARRPPDLLILDVMMPAMDGWHLLERWPGNAACPVIMLTAKDQELDKLRAFRMGVDDYVTKPFSFAELTARVGAVLNRSTSSHKGSAVIVTGDLEIDLRRRWVLRDGERIGLTPTEYRLLEVLAQHLDVPVASEELIRRVWGPAYAGEVDHVKHYIWALRRKLEQDPGDPQHILTERGFGYRLI